MNKECKELLGKLSLAMAEIESQRMIVEKIHMNSNTAKKLLKYTLTKQVDGKLVSIFCIDVEITETLEDGQFICIPKQPEI